MPRSPSPSVAQLLAWESSDRSDWFDSTDSTDIEDPTEAADRNEPRLADEPKEQELPIDSTELSVHGSHGMPAHQYPELLRLVADRRLDPALLVGRVIGLDEAGAALAAMGHPAGTVGMTVVRVDERVR